MIGERTAEDIKISIGTAHPSCEEKSISVMGRDLASGLPRLLTITSSEVRGAIAGTISKVIGAVRDTLENTPPELAADIVSRGIVLTGGGAKLPGLDLLIQEKTGIDVTVSENAEDCVAVGAGMALSVLADRSQNGARKQKRGLFGRK